MLCSCVIPTHSINGVKVFDKQVDTNMTSEEMEGLFDYVFDDPAWNDLLIKYEIPLDSFDQTEGNYRDWFQIILADWDIVFTSGWLAIPIDKSRIYIAGGVTDIKNKIIYLHVAPCYADSALIHELGHVIKWHMGEDPDMNHEDFEFWLMIKLMGNRMVKDLCPIDYEIEQPPNKFEF